MRVLLVCHRYPPLGVAGVERLSARTAEGLVGRGHEVTVLTRRPSQAPPTLRLERDLRNEVSVVSVAGAGAGSEATSFPGHSASMERIFERLLAETSADAVLATHLLQHSPGYVSTAHRHGVPVILELHDFFTVCPRAHLRRVSGDLCVGPEGGKACAVHCFPAEEADLRWALRSLSFAEVVRRADQVLAPSRFVADAFGPLRGDSAPIHVVGNGIGELGPANRSAPDPQRPLSLVSVGVTVEHKGFHVVIDALRRAGLAKSRYTILGLPMAPEAGRLRVRAAEVPGLELRLFGGFEPRHLPALLGDADLVVVPSLVAETYSIVVREAFACGVPVAGSDSGALPEAIRHGRDGWLFRAGDASDLAALLRELDVDRGLLTRAAAEIRTEQIETLDGRLDRVEELLELVAAGPRPHREPYEAELRLIREALVSRSMGR